MEDFESKNMGKIENAFLISGVREAFTVRAPDARSRRDWGK